MEQWSVNDMSCDSNGMTYTVSSAFGMRILITRRINKMPGRQQTSMNISTLLAENWPQKIVKNNSGFQNWTAVRLD